MFSSKNSIRYDIGTVFRTTSHGTRRPIRPNRTDLTTDLLDALSYLYHGITHCEHLLILIIVKVLLYTF